MRESTRGWGLALTAYAVVLAGVLAWPNGWVLNRFTVWLYVKGRRTFPEAVPEDYGVVLNVLAWAILVVLAGRALPKVSPLVWVVAGAVASVLAEIVQRAFLPAREALWADVLANTGGAVLGAALLSVWQVRDRRVRRGTR